MRISFCCAETKPEPWIAAFGQALPEAAVSVWAPGAAPADHAVVWSPPQVFFDQQPRLRGIFNIGAGVDALMRLRLPPGAVVVRLDDAGMSVQMAEYVCHAVIRHYREFDRVEADTRAGRWSYRKERDRADFNVGVMGLGVLGRRVAEALRAFEFPVRGWSRSAKAIDGIETFSGPEELDAFLAGTRVLICLLPLTADTENILDRRTLSKLKPGGYLVNVARGAHLVDDDLLALLTDGHLAGATLDVFRVEPLPPAHAFWTHPAITVTPHASARTQRDRSVTQIAAKIRAIERGESVAGQVDSDRGY